MGNNGLVHAVSAGLAIRSVATIDGLFYVPPTRKTVETYNYVSK